VNAITWTDRGDYHVAAVGDFRALVFRDPWHGDKYVATFTGAVDRARFDTLDDAKAGALALGRRVLRDALAILEPS
jgi:hypothetical protein